MNLPDFVYIGPNKGRGVRHRVVFSDSNEIITCSESHGWIGTQEQFAKEFRRVAEEGCR